jgi:hypothetical protein
MNLKEILQPAADQFSQLNLPEPVVHWGHPLMMGIVVSFMGGYGAYMGWKSRLTEDKTAKNQARGEHGKVIGLMFLFVTMGYSGGLLSLVMQDKPLMESPHFWTGSIALALLTLNSISARLINGKETSPLRDAHAYMGTIVLGVLIVHAALGIKLGLSI